MYKFHSKNDTETVSLVISNNKVEEIVDFNKESLGEVMLYLLVFENNPNLILGYNNTLSRVVSDTTEFRKKGAKQFFGQMFKTIDLIFSNFSASLKDIFDMDRSKERPWHWFSAHNQLLFEGNFSSFPDLLSFETFTVIIRNVKSLNETELLPENFLTQVTALRRLIIKNSEHVTVPKFYLQNVYMQTSTATYNLTIETELSNVQQDSLTERNTSNLYKINQVKVDDEMRNILSSKNNYSGCSIFCMKDNGVVHDCSALLDSEKIACGICVKNIIGLQNLQQRLREVCSIMEIKTVKTTTNPSEVTTLASKATPHISTTEEAKEKGRTLAFW